MAKKKKSATDLLENPKFTEDSPIFEPSPDEPVADGTPFDKSYNALTCTGGPVLELMTRSTKKVAKALDLGYTLCYNYKSPYIRGKLDLLMRTRVSMGGRGRAEMVQALQAGSGVPGEYYDKGEPSYKAFLEPDSDGTEDVE